jgi:hypothetical protein
LIDAHFISTKKGKSSLVDDHLTYEENVETAVDNNPNDDSVPQGGMKAETKPNEGIVLPIPKDGERPESEVGETQAAVQNTPNDESEVGESETAVQKKRNDDSGEPQGVMKNDGTRIVQKLKNDGECQESDVVEAPVAVEHKPNSDFVEGGAETENKKNDNSVSATATAGDSQIIGYECSLLLEDLKNIPEEHIKSFFLRPNRTIFLERIDFNLETQKNVEHWVKVTHALYSKWRNNVGERLPERVAVPHNCISHLFKCNWKDGDIMFRVHKIEGDGNCLYRSLAESSLMKTKIPDDVQRRHKFIRLQLKEFAKRNFTFTNFVWKNHGKSPPTTDPRLLQDAYNQWIETLSMNKEWGGPTEYILFAYCFEIHVVCIRQLVDRVDVFSTHEFYRNSKVRTSNVHNTMFGEIPNDLANVIFIWHHQTKKPQEPIDNVEVSGDHYSYLELDATYCPTNIPSGTFFLRHVDRDNSNEVLDVDADSPDVVRLEKPEKPPPAKSNAETLVVQEPGKSSSNPPTTSAEKIDQSMASDVPKNPPKPSISPHFITRKSERIKQPNEQMLMKNYFNTVAKNTSDRNSKTQPKRARKISTTRSRKKSARVTNKKRKRTSSIKENTIQDLETSDSDVGDHLDDDFSLLPEWVVVPFSDFISRCVTVLNPPKNIKFKVIPVPGDGNCFYYSVCQSRVFNTKFPEIMGNVMAVREAIHEYANQNPEYGKLLHESNLFDISYEKWLQRTKTMGKHASPAEARLFARVYGIHVISLMQSDMGIIYGIGTYDSEIDYCRDRNLPIPAKPPLEDTIFVWHHYYEEPMATIPYGASADRSLGNPADHYVLLEHRDNGADEEKETDRVFTFFEM